MPLWIPSTLRGRGVDGICSFHIPGSIDREIPKGVVKPATTTIIKKKSSSSSNNEGLPLKKSQ
jgi:hypothetical protein